MRWFVVCVVWICSSVALWAQDSVPKLDVTFEENETVPGQPLTLRLTVLVPTFMPDPPMWPDFETPNLMVRLPSKASSPTSKSIGGETWSGISRRYQITPVVPGTFEIPAGEVTVRYRALEGSDVLEATLPVPSQTVTGVVPEGAEGLDPFVAAEKLTLMQTVEGETTGLDAGASFSRVLEVKIEGVSPMFLPSVTPEEGLAGLRAYPESPAVEETENRGVVSGSRLEKTVYVVEGGVEGALPEVRVQWFNLKTGKVEEATTEAIDVQADAQALAPSAEPLEAAKVARWGAALVGLLLVGAGFVRWGVPVLHRSWEKAQDRRLQSAGYTYGLLKKALQKRDLSPAKQTYLQWSQKVPLAGRETEDAVAQAFLQIGAARFGNGSAPEETQAWDRLKKLCHRKHRETRYRRDTKAPDLPPLNPVSRHQN
ncbi:BatD family protein [Shimia sagamensis]|uniref:Oxygen tolerance n=1 Tax=Shimia sagamensis TaxID=1566352 RepID=A0ABY1P9D7_9RHOB|nr:BatD family protein [Shimia sagamensis]SMP28930.1 Oxygen tolerance [Shimia sagamensis]